MAFASGLWNRHGESVIRALRLMSLATVALVFFVVSGDMLAAADFHDESWRQNESVAFADALSSGRHVVVVFGAEWCPPCRRVEQVMSDERVFGVLSESFVLLHFDITALTEHDEAMQEKYRVPTLPAVIFVNADKQELGRWDHTNATVESFIDKMRSFVAPLK